MDVYKIAVNIAKKEGVHGLTRSILASHCRVHPYKLTEYLDTDFESFRIKIAQDLGMKVPDNGGFSDIRKYSILDSAYKIASKYGYTKLTISKLSISTRLSRTMIHNYFSGSFVEIKRHVIYRAIDRGNIEIIKDALIMGEIFSCELPKKTIDKLKILIGSRTLNDEFKPIL